MVKLTTVVEQDLFEQRLGFNRTTTLEEVLISSTFFSDNSSVKSWPVLMFVFHFEMVYN